MCRDVPKGNEEKNSQNVSRLSLARETGWGRGKTEIGLFFEVQMPFLLGNEKSISFECVIRLPKTYVVGRFRKSLAPESFRETICCRPGVSPRGARRGLHGRGESPTRPRVIWSR